MSDRAYDPAAVTVRVGCVLLVAPTDTVLTFDGVECRLWVGQSPEGRRIDLYVHRMATDDPVWHQVLDRIAQARPAPGGAK